MTLEDAMKELQKVLPADAYKGMPGATDFTDIDPHWARKVFTDVFGPQGIGWTFNFRPEAVTVTSQEKESSAKRKYTLHTASIDYAELRFAYVDGGSDTKWSEPIQCSGGSDNEMRHWAVRGAMTNAMNSGFAGLLWQLPVYLGIVNHKNVRSFTVGEIPTFREHTASTTTTTKVAKPAAAAASAKSAAPAAVAKPTAAIKADPATGEILEDEPTTAPAVPAKPAAAAPKAAAPTAPKPAAVATTTGPGDGAYIIPDGVSRYWSGKSLSDLAQSPKGLEALAYFARLATGGDKVKEAVKTQAQAYLAAHPELA